MSRHLPTCPCGELSDPQPLESDELAQGRGLPIPAQARLAAMEICNRCGKEVIPWSPEEQYLSRFMEGLKEGRIEIVNVGNGPRSPGSGQSEKPAKAKEIAAEFGHAAQWWIDRFDKFGGWAELDGNEVSRAQIERLKLDGRRCSYWFFRSRVQEKFAERSGEASAVPERPAREQRRRGQRGTPRSLLAYEGQPRDP